MAGLLAACALAPVAGAAVIGQGGVRMGADALWSRGFLGQGQTVAILDQGFAGLDRSIELGELPPRDRLTIRLFDQESGEGGMTELGLPTQHGVRMAELGHDLAPEANLVLGGDRNPAQVADVALAHGDDVGIDAPDGGLPAIFRGLEIDDKYDALRTGDRRVSAPVGGDLPENSPCL